MHVCLPVYVYVQLFTSFSIQQQRSSTFGTMQPTEQIEDGSTFTTKISFASWVCATHIVS